jgi:hypothetical protein
LRRSGMESKREIFIAAGSRDDVAKLVSSFFQGMLKRNFKSNFKNRARGIYWLAVRSGWHNFAIVM